MPISNTLPIDLQDVYNYAVASGYSGSNDLNSLLSWSGWTGLPNGADGLLDFLGVGAGSISLGTEYEVSDAWARYWNSFKIDDEHVVLAYQVYGTNSNKNVFIKVIHIDPVSGNPTSTTPFQIPEEYSNDPRYIKIIPLSNNKLFYTVTRLARVFGRVLSYNINGTFALVGNAHLLIHQSEVPSGLALTKAKKLNESHVLIAWQGYTPGVSLVRANVVDVDVNTGVMSLLNGFSKTAPNPNPLYGSSSTSSIEIEMVPNNKFLLTFYSRDEPFWEGALMSYSTSSWTINAIGSFQDVGNGVTNNGLKIRHLSSNKFLMMYKRDNQSYWAEILQYDEVSGSLTGVNAPIHIPFESDSLLPIGIDLDILDSVNKKILLTVAGNYAGAVYLLNYNEASGAISLAENKTYYSGQAVSNLCEVLGNSKALIMHTSQSNAKALALSLSFD